MDSDTNLVLSLVSSGGMALVAVAAVVYWRHVSRVGWRWLWAGVALWTVAVAIKIGVALLTNREVAGFLKQQLPHPAFLVAIGLFIGIESSLCEIGLTWLAVLKWRQLGRDADRAISVGVGAGAFEAFLLAIGATVAAVAALAHVPQAEQLREATNHVAATTPLFWLAAPVERIIAILCHASTRALVLLGVVHRRPMMVFWGLAIFTLLDGVAGGFLASGAVGSISTWWIELAVLPFGVVSIPILKWCRRGWPNAEAAGNAGENL